MTSIINILIAVKNELKANVWLISLGSILLTALLSALLYFGHITASLLPTFHTSMNTMSGGIQLRLNGLHFNQLDELSGFALQNFRVEAGGSSASVFYIGETAIPDISISAVYPFQSETDSQTADTSHPLVWISQTLATERQIMVGDIIENRINGLVLGTYRVEKILSDVETTTMVIPFKDYYQSHIQEGYFISHEVTATMSKSEDYWLTKSALKDIGIQVSTPYDDLYQTLAVLDYVFKLLFFIVGVISLMSFTKLIGLLIQNRLSFIRVQHILGRKAFQTSLIYFIIFELMLWLSLGFATLISAKMFEFTKNIAEGYYSQLDFSDYTLLYISAIFLIANALLIMYSIRIPYAKGDIS